jgi:uncharacterized cupin superfamily protein
VRKTNVFAAELDQTSEREGFRWRAKWIGRELGSAQIGISQFELAAGERTWPYHFHHGTEEWLIVLDGTPTLRTPDGERTLRRGDVTCFVPGPDGAHQLRGPGTVLLLSANRVPDTLEYLDSGKLGARPPGKIFRTTDAVDYWDGE